MFFTKEQVKVLLVESGKPLAMTYQAGLSSPGRLLDLFVTATICMTTASLTVSWMHRKP